MVRVLYFTVLLAGIASWSVPVCALMAAVHTVAIENMKFTPDNLTVIRGDSIIWINKDLVPHTVTSNDRTFDSKSISPGQSWKMRPRKAGKFSYKCSFHPTMKAAIIVR